MRSSTRHRRYVSRSALVACRPLLHYSRARDAYVLRGVGHRLGPVLKLDRRRGGPSGDYHGPERRGTPAEPLSRAAPTLSA